MKQYKPLDDVNSVLPILAQTSFLGGITEKKWETVFRRFKTALFEDGEYVARQDEEASHIYIIKRGKIELRLANATHTVNKRQFHVGDSFGEAALLSLVNNTASFVAVEPSELIVLSRRALDQIRKDDPDLFCHLILNLARDLARKLQYTDEMLLRLDPSSIDSRPPQTVPSPVT